MVSPCLKYVTCANAFETGRLGLYIDCSTTDLPTVRATPKSNSVDNVRALQGDATVLE